MEARSSHNVPPMSSHEDFGLQETEADKQCQLPGRAHNREGKLVSSHQTTQQIAKLTIKSLRFIATRAKDATRTQPKDRAAGARRNRSRRFGSGVHRDPCGRTVRMTFNEVLLLFSEPPVRRASVRVPRDRGPSSQATPSYAVPSPGS